jgi:hypothetical protein
MVVMEERTTNLSSPSKTTNVELRIEELLLDGFIPHDRFRIGQAIEFELTRLITENGVPKAWSVNQKIMNLDAGSIQIAQNSTPISIGTHIAQAVYRGSSQ